MPSPIARSRPDTAHRPDIPGSNRSGDCPKPTSAAKGKDTLWAIFFMCAGVSTFPFMNAAVKLLSAGYPALQITWARFTGHLIVMLLIFLPQYRLSLLQTRQPVVQITRSVLMLMSNLMFVMAIGRIPLGYRDRRSASPRPLS